ncbi:MAG: group II intron maturase-specific domain-containing protein [Oligoflexus sp.]
MKIEGTVFEFNNMIRGYIVCFRMADGRERLRYLDAWIYHHLRCIIWRQWETGSTRFEKLISIDVNRNTVAKAAWGR